MCTLYKNIKDLCDRAGIKPGRMCSDLGVSRSILTGLKNGTKKTVNSVTAQKFADYLGVSVGFLLGDETHPDMPASTGGVWIPVLGRVAAGIPIEAVETVEDYEEISHEMATKGEHFALRIKGDSMMPRIQDGDVVIVRSQPDCENGEVAVVIVNGQDATVKRIKKGPEGIMLIPNNPAYEPMFYTNSDIEQLPVRILGKVVELRGKF